MEYVIEKQMGILHHISVGISQLDDTEPNPKWDHALTLRSALLDVAHYSCSCAASSYDGSPRMLSRGGTPPPINPLEAIE